MTEQLCRICGVYTAKEDGLCPKCKGAFGNEEGVGRYLLEFAERARQMIEPATAIDPTDWRDRSIRMEKALRKIDEALNMRMSKYLKSSAYNVQHLSYEQWLTLRIDEAIDTVRDLLGKGDAPSA